MGRISLFHGTTKAAAGQICAHGFRDATGTYMTSMEFTGVWLSDRPLDENEGACSQAYLEVQIERALVEEYELEVGPFLLAILILVFMIMLFPPLVLFVPNLLMGQ